MNYIQGEIGPRKANSAELQEAYYDGERIQATNGTFYFRQEEVPGLICHVVKPAGEVVSLGNEPPIFEDGWLILPPEK